MDMPFFGKLIVPLGLHSYVIHSNMTIDECERLHLTTINHGVKDHEIAWLMGLVCNLNHR